MVCTPCRWLQYNTSANYDVLAITSAQDAPKVVRTCRHCVLVYGHELEPSAGRYAALEGLAASDQWQSKVAGRYDYIYFPDEEVVQAVEAVNR